MTLQKPTEGHADRFARAIEYTDLRKTISSRDVETMCAEAILYRLGVVVVPSALVRQAVACASGGGPSVGTVISYPFGTQAAVVKAREAAAAVEHGARELDLVPHFGAILAERWSAVRAELAELRHAAGAARLKLVLETGRLTASSIRETCAIAANEGFEYVVNTVGFRLVSTDPDAEGLASVEVVRSLRELSGDALRLKAAGGIVGLDLVEDLLNAGVDRIAISVASGALRRLGLVSDAEGGRS